MALSADAIDTISGNPGNYVFNLTAGKAAFNADISTSGSDWQNCKIVLATGTQAVFNTRQTIGGLELDGTATASVSSGGGGANGNVMVIGSGGLSIASTATLDLTDNDMILQNAGSAGVTELQSLLASGYHAGDWKGTGLLSSSAASTVGTSMQMAIGYSLNCSPSLSTPFTTFDGIAVGSNDVIAKYTLAGDQDLNGVVNNIDYLHWRQNNGKTRMSWPTCDFNYDGLTNTTDYNLLEGNYGQTITGPAYSRPLQPTGQTIAGLSSGVYSGPVGSFTDSNNPTAASSTASYYVATIDWGDGVFHSATVTANGNGGFTVTATSPFALSDPNALIVMQVQYATGSPYAGQEGSLSTPITLVPQAITNLTATAASTSEIDLTWTLSVTDSTGIQIQRSTDGTNFTPIATLDTTATTYADTGLNEGEHYWYEVTAQPLTDVGASATVDAWALPAGAPSSTYAISVLSDGPTGYWRLGDTSGNVATDLTQNGLSGTYAGNTTQSEDGIFGASDDPATAFDGTSGYVTIPYNAAFNSSTFTAEAWVDTLGTSTTHAILSRDSGAGNRQFQLDLNSAGDPELVLYSGGTAYSFASNTPITDGTWHSVAGTFDGSTVSLYVDGQSVLSAPFSGPLDSASSPLTIGSAASALTGFFQGAIDEAAIFAHALTAAVIQAENASASPIIDLTAAPRSDDEIDLDWGQRQPNQQLKVYIDRSTDGKNYTSIDDRNTPLTFENDAPGMNNSPNLQPGTHYWYKLTASTTGSGNVIYAPIYIDSYTVPDSPSELTASVNANGAVHLSWTPPAKGTESGYDIQRSPDVTDFSVIGSVASGTTTYDDTSVVDGTQYYYQVVATTPVAQSQPTFWASATTPLLGATQLQAVPASSSEIDLSWVNNSCSATGFTVNRSNDGVSYTQVASLGPDADSYSDTPLSVGQPYYYTITANGASGVAPVTCPVTYAVTLPITLVSTPGPLIENQSLTLTPSLVWSENGAYPLASWNVDWGDGNTQTFSGSASTFTHTYTTPGTYSIIATAVTTGGASIPNPVTAVVADPPPTLAMGSPGTAQAGTVYTLPLTFSNPGADTITNWVIDWGDGTIARSSGSTMPPLTHTYARGGISFNCTATVFTDDGAVYAAATIPVSGLAPGTNADGYNNVLFTSSGAANESATSPFDVFYCGTQQSAQYMIDWGDGSATTSGQCIEDQHTPVTHTYAEQGSYLAKVTLDIGTYREVWFDIADEARPSLAAIPAQAAVAGQLVTVTSSFTGLDTDGPTMATVDWGDGHGPQPVSIAVDSTGAGSIIDSTTIPAGGLIGVVTVYDETTSVSQPFTITASSVQLVDDAQNVDGYADPLRTDNAQQEAIKDNPGLPGKIIQVDNNDSYNLVPYFADFDLSSAKDMNGNVPQFVPMDVVASYDIDLSTAKVTITYDGQSLPSAIVRAADGAYYVTSGYLRLWTKDASSTRNPASVASGGNFIVSGEQLTAAQFFGETNGVIANQTTIYAEAVRPDATSGAHQITVTITSTDSNGFNHTQSDSVRVTCASLQMAVDWNGDGTINMDGTDLTAATTPFRFWLNDNTDGYNLPSAYGIDYELGGGAASIANEAPDSSSIGIGSSLGVGDLSGGATSTQASELTQIFRRDLEDFAQVGLAYSSLLTSLADTVEFDIADPSTTGMGLRLWRSETASSYYQQSDTGEYSFSATDQVSNPAIADSIMSVTQNALYSNPNSFRSIYADSTRSLSMPDFEQQFGALIAGNSHLLRAMFEGITAGAGTVQIRFLSHGSVIAQSGFNLDLHPATDLYEHYSVSYGAGVGAHHEYEADPKTTPVPTQPLLIDGTNAASYASTKDYLLYINGWNMSDVERVLFADQAYKRLYWEGYRGTFGLFDWPTQFTNNPVTDAGNFDRSEEVAWNSAAGLENLLKSLQVYRQAGGKLALLGHSMGNIVMSEALYQAGSTNLVDTAIFSQAAISSEFFYYSGFDTEYADAFLGSLFQNMPRFSRLNQAATRLVNFANPNDYALNAWRLNNDKKPGGVTHSNYVLVQTGWGGDTYDGELNPVAAITRTAPNANPVPLSLGSDAYEMFANGLNVHGAAIGAEPAMVGPFSAYVNLSDPSYGFSASRSDHSGEFNYSLIDVSGYWKALLQQTGIR